MGAEETSERRMGRGETGLGGQHRERKPLYKPVNGEASRAVKRTRTRTGMKLRTRLTNRLFAPALFNWLR